MIYKLKNSLNSFKDKLEVVIFNNSNGGKEGNRIIRSFKFILYN